MFKALKVKKETLVHIPLLLVCRYKVDRKCKQRSLKKASVFRFLTLFFQILKAQKSVGTRCKCYKCQPRRQKVGYHPNQKQSFKPILSMA